MEVSMKRAQITALFAAAMLASLVGEAMAQAAQVRDASGALVGLFVGGAGPDIDLGPPSSSVVPALRVMSDRGYLAAYGVGTGRIAMGTYVLPSFSWAVNMGQLSQSLYFTTPDCSGQAYVVLNVGAQQTGVYGGFVFATGIPGLPPYYAPKGEQAIGRPLVASRGGDGACGPNGASNIGSLPAVPNNPSVTGFPNAPFVPPLTLGYSDAAWLLFRNGFESVRLGVAEGRSNVG